MYSRKVEASQSSHQIHVLHHQNTQPVWKIQVQKKTETKLLMHAITNCLTRLLKKIMSEMKRRWECEHELRQWKRKQQQSSWHKSSKAKGSLKEARKSLFHISPGTEATCLPSYLIIKIHYLHLLCAPLRVYTSSKPAMASLPSTVDCQPSVHGDWLWVCTSITTHGFWTPRDIPTLKCIGPIISRECTFAGKYVVNTILPTRLYLHCFSHAF